MQNKPFRLDRTKFKAQSFKSASHQRDFWMGKSVAERLRAAYYLISVAYGYDLSGPPKFDKTAFCTRKWR